MTNSGQTFRREEHLKGRKEIREVFGKGKQYSCYQTPGLQTTGLQTKNTGVKLFVLRNELPYNRICFSLSRGFENAVSRNRAKRLGREAFRLMKHRLDNGYDLILLVYPESRKSLSDRVRQLNSLFKKAGLLK